MYVKLFRSILNSTVWMLPDNILRVWLSMLLLADSDGMVRISIPGLAKEARVSIDECKQALETLEAPDPESQSKLEEGRRLLRCGDEPVWLIVNYQYYRSLRDSETRKQYMREYMREYREKKKLTSVNTRKPRLAQEEGEGEGEEYSGDTIVHPKTDSRAQNSNPFTDDFLEFWKEYPKKKAKRDAFKAWKQTKKERPPIEEVIQKVRELKETNDWLKDGGQFIPFPASWIRSGGWEDEPGPRTSSADGYRNSDIWDSFGPEYQAEIDAHNAAVARKCGIGGEE